MSEVTALRVALQDTLAPKLSDRNVVALIWEYARPECRYCKSRVNETNYLDSWDETHDRYWFCSHGCLADSYNLQLKCCDVCDNEDLKCLDCNPVEQTGKCEHCHEDMHCHSCDNEVCIEQSEDHYESVCKRPRHNS